MDGRGCRDPRRERQYSRVESSDRRPRCERAATADGRCEKLESDIDLRREDLRTVVMPAKGSRAVSPVHLAPPVAPAYGADDDGPAV